MAFSDRLKYIPNALLNALHLDNVMLDLILQFDNENNTCFTIAISSKSKLWIWDSFNALPVSDDKLSCFGVVPVKCGDVFRIDTIKRTSKIQFQLL